MPRPLVTVSPRVAALAGSSVPRPLRRVPRAAPMHTEWDGDVSAAAERIAAVTGDDVVGIVLALHRFVHTSLRVHAGRHLHRRRRERGAGQGQGRLPGLRPPGRGDVPEHRDPGPLRVRVLLRPVGCHRGRRRRRRGPRADPRLVRGRHPRLGVAGPRSHQRAAGRPAPHHDRPRPRLRRRAAGARRLRRRRTAQHRRQRRDPPPLAGRPAAAKPSSCSHRRPSVWRRQRGTSDR